MLLQYESAVIHILGFIGHPKFNFILKINFFEVC